MTEWQIIEELKNIRKEATMAKYNVLLWRVIGLESVKKISKYIRTPAEIRA